MSLPTGGTRSVLFQRRAIAGSLHPLDQLLALALDAIDGCACSDPPEEAIRLAGQIRTQCLRRGMQRSEWSYLARHGTAWLRVFLKDVPPRSKWKATALALTRLRGAGSPQPPSAELLARWLSITELDVEDMDRPRGLRLLGLYPEVGLQMLFRAGGALQSESEADQFLSALPLILQWISTDPPTFDRNQQRAGWSWMVSRSRQWLEAKRQELIAAGLHRKPETVAISDEGYTAVPVSTGVELLELGLALHNCMPSYLNYYLGPTKLMYRIENDEGTAVAAVALDFDGKCWRVERVAGLANRAVADPIRALAERILDYVDTYGDLVRDPDKRDEYSNEEGKEYSNEEGKEGPSGCPYCGSGDECEHLLLTVDLTFRESLGGALYGWFRSAWNAVCRDNEDNDTFDEFAAFAELIDRVEAHAAFSSDDEFNGAPGQSSAYRLYWCESLERTAAAAEAVR